MHIAIILDGNRRFAKKQKLKPWIGHRHGASKVKDLFSWAQELSLSELTLYAFSVENFSRPKEEKDELFSLFRKNFSSLKKEDLAKKQTRVTFIGRLSLFPKDIQEDMAELTKKTAAFDKLKVNFCMGYGGRDEITHAVQAISEEVLSGKIAPSEISEQTITDHLYLSSEPEIIIRPGGEIRVSNFLIWQGNYSEWFFLDKLWPEFEKSDLEEILRLYSERQRRFGK